MSSSLLSLGQTVHCSVKHRWQLASEATIQVAGISDIAQATGSNLQRLELLTNRDIWMRRAHGFNLSVEILLGGESFARTPGAAELFENLGVSLRDAEVISFYVVAFTFVDSSSYGHSSAFRRLFPYQPAEDLPIRVNMKILYSHSLMLLLSGQPQAP